MRCTTRTASGWALACLVAALATAEVHAAPPPAVAADAYARVPNGIPTPRDNDDSYPDVNDVINLLKGFDPGDPEFLSSNDATDRYFVERDGLWRDLDGSVAFLGISARNKNILGVYTQSGEGIARMPLLGPHTGFGIAGKGTPESPFPASLLGLDMRASFGWYLEADYTEIFYSEDSRNRGGWDHLFSYAIGSVRTWVRYPDGEVAELVLDDAYVLAWEDMTWDGISLGDEDYDDMLYLVGHVITSAQGPTGQPPEMNASSSLAAAAPAGN